MMNKNKMMIILNKAKNHKIEINSQILEIQVQSYYFLETWLEYNGKLDKNNRR